MLERIGQEVAGRRFLDEIIDRHGRRKQRNGIEQDRRSAVDHVLRLHPTPVRGSYTANLGGNDFEHSLLFRDC
ncbi:hypothetical protein D3C87_1709700 [compost metagenome]